MMTKLFKDYLYFIPSKMNISSSGYQRHITYYESTVLTSSEFGTKRLLLCKELLESARTLLLAFQQPGNTESEADNAEQIIIDENISLKPTLSFARLSESFL